MDLFYKGILKSKTSLSVPVFNSGRASHSMYDPEREAKNFGKEVLSPSFILVFGIAGGYHIASLSERAAECKILCVERSPADIDFLKENVPLVKELSLKKNLIFASKDDFCALLLQNYFPAIDGSLSILSLRAWANEDETLFSALLEAAKKTVKKISADFSVQAHFGAIWQRNIFSNLLTLIKMEGQKNSKAARKKIDTNKTAIIVAAGPSLDAKIERIKKERESLYVIAVDTSLRVLVRHQIQPDAVVSIDAQFVSSSHFYLKADESTLFVLSLDSCPSVARHFLNGKNILFTSSGHPLEEAASAFCKRPFPRLLSGSGTVTIAALDFARKCGFKKAFVFGADFSYIKGRPYCRGTYLDDIYRAKEDRIFNAETKYSSLMFRTPLKKYRKEDSFSTEILDSYRESFYEWIQSQGATFEYKDHVYSIDFLTDEGSGIFFDENEFNKAAFKNFIQGECNNEKTRRVPQILLPFIAFLRNKNPKTFCIKNAIKLAENQILVYNGVL